MDIRDIRIFQAVAKTKNITKASGLLYMTPQGISKVIKNLEQECGSDLFYRRQGGLELTPAGQCFSAYADEFNNKYRAMQNDLLHIRQKERGIVDLLSAYGILRMVTPECIIAFRREHPDIEFHYREYPDREVERLFEQHEGNVAFSIAEFDESKYDVFELASFPIRLLVSQKHPLARRSAVTIEDLKNQPLYIENNNFKIHQLILDRCGAAGFCPNIVFETCGFSLCHKMVRENKGVSVTVDFITDDMSKEGLRLLPFSDGDYFWKMCMLLRKSDVISPAVSLFQEHVITWIRGIQKGEIVRNSL